MAQLSPLRIPIQGIDKFSNKLAKIQKKVDKFAGKMKKAGTKMTAGITAPATLMGAAIFKSGYQFDKFMNMVEAKSTVAGKSIEDLRKKAKDLGSSTSFSHIQAAEAMGYLAQAGYNTGQTFAAILPTLNLATATNTDLANSADWLSNIMGGMGWEAERAGDAAAILAMATAKANVNLEDLSYTFGDVGPVAKQFGASLEDVAAATGFLGNIGIKGTKAGTALKTMFASLAAPTTDAAKAIKKLGVATDINGKMRDFKDILADLAQVLPTLKQKDAIAVMDKVFGRRAIAGVAGLTDNLQKTNGQFMELVGTLNNVGEADLQKMVDTMRKGSVGAFDDTVSALQGLGQAIADSGFMVMVSDFLRFVTKIARKLGEFSPAILKMATLFGMLAAAIGPVLVVIGSILPVITALAAKIAAAGGVMALLSNPVGWVIAGIVALIAVIVALWDELAPLRHMIMDITTRAFSRLAPILKSVKKLFSALWAAVKAVVKALQPLLMIIPGLFDGPALEGLDLFAKALAGIVDMVTWAVEKFTKLVGLVGKLTQGAKELSDMAGNKIDSVTGFFGGLKDAALEKVGLADPKKSGEVGRSLSDAIKVKQEGKLEITVTSDGAKTKVTQEGGMANIKNKKKNNGAILAGGI